MEAKSNRKQPDSEGDNYVTKNYLKQLEIQKENALITEVEEQINQKKKLSMTCYTNALNSLGGDGDEELDGPAARRVQKCLQKLLRALHKDRHHTIQHYRHILDTSLEQVHNM